MGPKYFKVYIKSRIKSIRKDLTNTFRMFILSEMNMI